ncbi:MAG: ABC transporter permease [Rhodospirillales bacterium]|nr:ABC transporter permease [Rhodospirillales bacterium]
MLLRRRHGTASRDKHKVSPIAPVLLFQTVFFVAPIGILFVYSFWRMQDFRLITEFSFHNYREMANNPLLIKAFFLSLRVALVVTVVCAVLAFPIAYFISKKAGRWKVACLVAVIIPFWTSFVLRAYAWKLLLGERGVINTGLVSTGIIEAPLSYLLYSPFATAIGLIYGFLPFMVMPIYTSLEKVKDSWIDAAADLGASPARATWEVTLPLCIPGLVVGCVFTFIFALGEYVIPAMLGGGKDLLMAQAIVLEFELSQNWPGGAAISVVLLAIVFAVVAAVLRWVKMEEVL